MKSYSLLNSKQKRWLESYCLKAGIKLNIKKFDGIIFILKSGCQWRLLPPYYGKWKSVYHYFRGISECQWFNRMLKQLLNERRKRIKGDRGQNPSVAIIDSQSSKSGLPRSQKGIDGNKRVKGIKRHIAVDSDGLPLAVAVTTANVHDSKGAYPLIADLSIQYKSIKTIKADNGYKGKLTETVKDVVSIDMQCVKSNYGTSEFIPLEGRWVVERTIAWLDNFRRLCRNYEQLLSTAKAMVRMAFLMILIKHI
ncbi:MAG: IS5 family transposase [Lachnoclostridium sp.]|nr:IS5 family transposase [Lachnoclostridium sp.]